MPLDRLPSEILLAIMGYLGREFFDIDPGYMRLWWRWDILARDYAPKHIRIEHKDWGAGRKPADAEWNTVIQKFKVYGDLIEWLHISFHGKNLSDKHSKRVRKDQADRVNKRLQQVTEMLAGCKKLTTFSLDTGPPFYNTLRLPLLDTEVVRKLLETLHGSGRIIDMSLSFMAPLSGDSNIWPVIKRLVASGTLKSLFVCPYAISLDDLEITEDDDKVWPEELSVGVNARSRLRYLPVEDVHEDSYWCFVDLVKVLYRRALEPRDMRIGYLEEWFANYCDAHSCQCWGYCEIQRNFDDGENSTNCGGSPINHSPSLKTL